MGTCRLANPFSPGTRLDWYSSYWHGEEYGMVWSMFTVLGCGFVNEPAGCFNKRMVKIVSSLLFRGLVPILLTPKYCCYQDPEQTIGELNGLVVTPALWGIFSVAIVRKSHNSLTIFWLKGPPSLCEGLAIVSNVASILIRAVVTYIGFWYWYEDFCFWSLYYHRSQYKGMILW